MAHDVGGHYDFLFKVVLVGESGVGKSSLIQQFTQGEFQQDLRSTIGVEFALHEMEIEAKKVRTQIWDTAGQERYRAITNLYYRRAHGVILVYDVTSHPTFRAVERWLVEARAHVPEDAVFMMVGNKTDLRHLRTVDRGEGQKLAERERLSFIETSAAGAVNVEAAFQAIIQEMYHAAIFRDMGSPAPEPQHGLALHQHKGRRKGCC